MSLFTINPPDAITFDISPASPKTQTLSLTNTSSSSLAYKIRTTASKAYLVKPNQGYLKPNDSVSISITIQLTEIQGEVRHKFMILATPSVNCDDFALWNNIPKEKIVDVKLDVNVGAGKPAACNEPKKQGGLGDTKGSVSDVSIDELSALIKKQEAEKTALEAKLNQINSELRIKELKVRKGDPIRFKTTALVMYAIGGLIYGYLSA